MKKEDFFIKYTRKKILKKKIEESGFWKVWIVS